jgi:hypothetical protein
MIKLKKEKKRKKKVIVHMNNERGELAPNSF